MQGFWNFWDVGGIGCGGDWEPLRRLDVRSKASGRVTPVYDAGRQLQCSAEHVRVWEVRRLLMCVDMMVSFSVGGGG